MAKAQKKKPAARPEKVVLTKEQKQRVGQMLRIENRVSVCRDYIGLWSQFFQFFADDIQRRQITEQEEKAFFQTITGLARKHFLFCELMGDTFEGGDRIVDVLVNSVSLANIKGMNETMLAKLELDWHQLLLEMHVGLGRLLRRLPAGMKMDDAIARADAMAKGSVPPPVEKKGLLGFFSRKG